MRVAMAMVLGLVIGSGQSAYSQTQSNPDARVADIVQTGKLRIGVFPSFQYSKDASGKAQGLALGIANALASGMGVREVVTVEYPTPPQVIACVKEGGCDVGFMLVDPARAKEVDFTPAFVRSDFTYLVPPGSPLKIAADVDRPGIRIAVVGGHASTISLVRIIKQAKPVYADTFDPTFELLRSGQADAFASIREILIQYSAQLPGSRVLEDNYQINLAGIAVPKENSGRLAHLTEALDRMKRSGALKRLVEENSLRGVEVVPPN
jgi:polar amino acid transport system substrate-binding protein